MATANAFLGSGKIRVDRKTDAGASTGYLDLTEAGVLEITETTELKSMASKGRDSYGQTVATVQVKQPAQVRLSMKEVDADKLAIALLGSTAAETVVGAAVSDEDVTLIPERWVKLANRNITAHDTGTEITAEVVDGGTSIALTDLELDLSAGLVKYTGSTLTAATECHISYTHGGYTATLISGSTQPRVTFAVLFEGENQVTGETVEVEIDEAIVTPESPVDFLNDEFLELTLSGEMRTLAGAAAPYRVRVVDAA